jgi:hypothetical protein
MLENASPPPIKAVGRTYAEAKKKVWELKGLAHKAASGTNAESEY